MRLTTRDWVATALVLAAVILAVGWFIGMPGVDTLDVRAVTLGILVLGMPASAAAVVPGFSALIHGSRLYLFSASALGLAAFAAAILTFINGTELTLVAVVVLMVTLWVAATVRHAGGIGPLLARPRG
jgi:hypothetical protein